MYSMMNQSYHHISLKQIHVCKGWTILFLRGEGGFCTTFFFSLASVSFYCKGCAGNIFLKSSTPSPNQKSNGLPLVVVVVVVGCLRTQKFKSLKVLSSKVFFSFSP